MKLGVVGKGGVGKTTVAALLARVWSGRGARVVAVDADSNPNLGLSLGLSLEDVAVLAPVPPSLPVGHRGEMTAKILLQEYGTATPAGVTLVSAIRVERAGGGGKCGSHATVRSLLGGGIEHEADVTVVDMEAGLEHLTRAGGTLAHADLVLIVTEPSPKAVEAAARAAELARGLGVPFVYGLGNKARSPADERFLAEAADAHDLPLAGIIPYDAGLDELEREPRGTAAKATPAAVLEAVERVVDRLEWVTMRRARGAPPL